MMNYWPSKTLLLFEHNIFSKISLLFFISSGTGNDENSEIASEEMVYADVYETVKFCVDI
jgi:hypothetical protein